MVPYRRFGEEGTPRLPYLFHSEGPDDVLGEQLGLDEGHLHVSVDLRVVGPVLAALYLRGEREQDQRRETRRIRSARFMIYR